MLILHCAVIDRSLAIWGEVPDGSATAVETIIIGAANAIELLSTAVGKRPKI